MPEGVDASGVVLVTFKPGIGERVSTGQDVVFPGTGSGEITVRLFSGAVVVVRFPCGVTSGCSTGVTIGAGTSGVSFTTGVSPTGEEAADSLTVGAAVGTAVVTSVVGISVGWVVTTVVSVVVGSVVGTVVGTVVGIVVTSVVTSGVGVSVGAMITCCPLRKIGCTLISGGNCFVICKNRYEKHGNNRAY